MTKFFLTGGTLRNFLLEGARKLGNDADFAVEADSFDAMLDALAVRGVMVWKVDRKMVTVRGMAPFSMFGDFDGFVRPKRVGNVGFPADFTLCRAETMYSDKRHPDTVTPTDLHTDLARRDFTVNALAVSEDGVWHDPFGGTLDADGMLLRTVGAARLRFDEDPLRMLRAVRFAVQHDLTFDDDVTACLSTWRGVKDVATLPKERVMDELNKSFAHDWAATMRFLFVQHPHLGFVVSGMGLKLKATT